MSLETTIYAFLRERVEAVNASGDPPALDGYSAAVAAALKGVEVLPDEQAEIKAPKGIRIGDAVARVAPSRGYESVEHFDALVVLIIYRAVGRTDRQARTSYREEVLALAEAVAMLFFREPGLPQLGSPESSRVRNSRPLRIPRGSDSVDGKTYAVANLQLVVNETGEIDFTGKR